MRVSALPGTKSVRSGSISATLLLLGIMLVTMCLSARAAFVPVDFSASFNRRMQDNAWGSIGLPAPLLSPSGTTLLNGVPFNIPVNGNNYWHSYQPGAGATAQNPSDNNQPRVLSIPVSISNASRVYTLMDTFWGAAFPMTYAKLEAFGTGGAYTRIDLYGNVHVRDFNQNTWTNSLNQFPVGSQQMLTWTYWFNFPGPQRLDRQQFDLGNAFLGKTLTELRFTDSGGYFTNNPGLSQRIFVAGVTVQTSTTLTVTLNPAEARGAGAQWHVDGGPWQNSGVTLSGLSAGNHTVTYKAVSGWAQPAAQPLTLVDGAARNFTAAYTLATGSLQVGISPPGAVTAGAQWQVDGGPWQNSGDLTGGLSPGNHTVSFRALNGWDAPPPQVTGIIAGQTTGVTVAYNAHPGSLQVVINPADAVTAGAQWQVDGGPFQNSGATMASLTPGTHTVAFKTTALWNAPASQNVTVVSDQVATASGNYTQMTGALQVAINPAGAVTDGAQWQVDGGAFQNSGATLTGITAGSHTLSFKAINGWATPAVQTVAINPNATITASGTYTANPGSLQVTLNPVGAVTAGAQWQVDGGAFQNSGATVSGLSAGSHTIVFKPVNGWSTPANQPVTITSGNTTTATGTYTPGIGSLTVTIVPAGAVTAGAQWRVDGGAYQNSGTTLTNLASGTHTVSYSQLNGWGSPEDQTVNVPAGGTGQATGFYTPKTGSLVVKLQPDAAVAAGAQWQVDGGALQNDGATVSGLNPGSHTVSFKPVPGWVTPGNQTVTIALYQTTGVTGTYTGAAGTLQVTLTPPGAVTAGAQWQLDGGPFQNSGVTLSNLTAGNHTIGFKNLGDWTSPPPQTVTVSTGNAGTANGAYYPDCTPPGLVAWWKADENALDTLGYHHATLSGGVAYAPGTMDQAFQLDGVNDSAKVGASPRLNVGPGSGLTMAAWINPASVSSSHAVLEWNDSLGNLGVHLFVGTPTPGALYANLVSTTGAYHTLDSGAGVILPNEWQHVALTFDRLSGVATLYRNGVVVSQQTFPGFTPQTSYDLFLGKRESSPGGEPPFWFAGGMDSVQIFDRALTATEVTLSSAGCKWQTYDNANGGTQSWVYYDALYPNAHSYGGAWYLGNRWPGAGTDVTIRHPLGLNNNSNAFPGSTLDVNSLNLESGARLSSSLSHLGMDGSSEWKGGYIQVTGSGTIQNKGSIAVTAATTIGRGGSFVNTGHVDIQTALWMEFGSAAFINQSGQSPASDSVAEVELSRDGAVFGLSNSGGGGYPFINNYGVLRKSGGGTSSIDNYILNYADSPLNRAGTIAVDSGTLLLQPGVTSVYHGLKAELAPGSVLLMKGSNLFENGNISVTGGGVLRLEKTGADYFYAAPGATATVSAPEGKLECNGAEMRGLINTGSINVTALSTWNGMVNQGHVRVLAGAGLKRNGAPISNGTPTSHTAILDLEDDAGFPIDGTALNNYALLRKNGPGVSTIDSGRLNVYGAASPADSGAIEVTGGTLRLPGVQLYFLNGGRIRVANGATLDLVNFYNLIDGGGTLTVTGSGKVRLQPGASLSTSTPATPSTFDAAPGTFEFNGGQVNGPLINAGEMFITAPTSWGYAGFLGDVTNNGTIHMTAGSAGTGNSLALGALVYITCGAGGTLEFDIAGRPNQPTQWARMVNGGQSGVSYGGKLRINFGNFTPLSGDRWLVLSDGGGSPNSGDFASVEFTNVPAGFTPTYEKLTTGSRGIRIGLDAAPAPQTYAQWAAAQNFPTPAAAAFDLDFDGDGVPNGMEAALGTNPKSSASKPAGQVVPYNRGGDIFLGVEFTRPGGAGRLTNVQFTGERSNDLLSWTTSGVIVEFGPLNAQGQDTIILRFAEPVGYYLRSFLRLRVQQL